MVKEGADMLKFNIRHLAADDTGSAAIEYALVAMLIGVGLVGMMLALGEDVETHYETVGTKYAAAANGKAGE